MHNLKHTVQWVLINEYICVASTLSKILAISITLKRVFIPSSCQFPSPHIQPVLWFLFTIDEFYLFLNFTLTGSFTMYFFVSAFFCSTYHFEIHPLLHVSLVHYFLKCWPVFHCMYILEFIQSLVHGHLSCFHVLTVRKHEAMNTAVQAFLWTYSSIPLWSGITRI